MGSLYFLRRKRCCTSTSIEGGRIPAPIFRSYRSIALTYCSPRNTSSSSFSRFAWKRQAGNAAVIMIDITPSMTSSAAIAYPRAEP